MTKENRGFPLDPQSSFLKEREASEAAWREEKGLAPKEPAPDDLSPQYLRDRYADQEAAAERINARKAAGAEAKPATHADRVKSGGDRGFNLNH